MVLGVAFIKRPPCYHINMIFFLGLPFTIPSAHNIELFDPQLGECCLVPHADGSCALYLWGTNQVRDPAWYGKIPNFHCVSRGGTLLVFNNRDVNHQEESYVLCHAFGFFTYYNNVLIKKSKNKAYVNKDIQNQDRA